MSMMVWVNFYKVEEEGELEVSIPYTSKRSALKARLRQPKRIFIDQPKNISFDLSEMGDVSSPRRCEDCIRPSKDCILCLTIDRD